MNGKDNSISITLKDNKSNYQPGELLQGTIRWDREQSKIPLELRLGWVISNETVQDVMCHSSERYALRGRMGTKDFEVMLPMGPHSVSAELFQLQWMLEAQTSDKKFFLQIPISIRPNP